MSSSIMLILSTPYISLTFYSASRFFVLEHSHRMQRKGPGAPIAALTQRGTVDPAIACYFLWKTIALVRF
jgi:hypothetical protein